MKKDILEHIIKSVLLERKLTAIAVNANKKELELAKAAGAAAALTIKVKGKSSSLKDISSQIYGAIAGSAEAGVSSKFADSLEPDYYVYVYANPLKDVRKQRIPVWIFKLTKRFELYGQDANSDDDITWYVNIYHIGETPLIPKSAFAELSKKQDEWYQTALKMQQLKAEKEAEEAEKISAADTALAKRQEWLAQNDTENLTFPYVWYTYDNTKQPVKFTVYKETILDNVPYLYFYDKQYDLFFVMKRIDQFLPTIIKEQLNPNFTSYTWQKLWDQIDITKVTPEEKSKLEVIYLKEK